MSYFLSIIFVFKLVKYDSVARPIRECIRWIFTVVELVEYPSFIWKIITQGWCAYERYYWLIYKNFKLKQKKKIMADFEDETEFNSEDVQKIAEEAVNNVIGSDQIEYQREKVN